LFERTTAKIKTFSLFTGRPIVSLGEYETVCMKFSSVPDDIDQPFIPAHILHIDNLDKEANFFRFFVTTKRLIGVLKQTDLNELKVK